MQMMPTKVGNSDEGDDGIDDLLWDDDVDAGLRPEDEPLLKPSLLEKTLTYGQSGCCCLIVLAALVGVLVPYFTQRLDPGLRDSVRHGDLEKAREILDDNPKMYVDAPGDDEKTALHWAVIKNKPRMVSFLLERRANIDLGSESGDAALHYAAREGHTEILQMLLDRGASVNKTDDNGWTALHWAALYDHPAAAKQLIKADVDTFVEADDDYHKTALALAQSNGHSVLVRIIDKAMQEAENQQKVTPRARDQTETR